jgi:hypothetical protein
MSDVVELSELQAHVVIKTVDAVHVVPVSCLRAFSKGRLSLESIDDGEALMRAITESWLEMLKHRN